MYATLFRQFKRKYPSITRIEYRKGRLCIMFNPVMENENADAIYEELLLAIEKLRP